MKISILTLFPNMFDGVFQESIIKRAVDEKKVEINLINFRDYTNDPHNKVDDTPYGGGAGMVLMCQPIFDCVKSIRTEESKVILMTPDGIPYKQKMAYDLSNEKHLIIICGHYEGFDERIRSICDLEVSIGDYVLTGGEVPAMVLVDSITRLLPGVIREDSHLEDSFNGCTSMSGTIEINSTYLMSYHNALKNTQITEVTGTVSDELKANILATK